MKKKPGPKSAADKAAATPATRTPGLLTLPENLPPDVRERVEEIIARKPHGHFLASDVGPLIQLARNELHAEEFQIALMLVPDDDLKTRRQLASSIAREDAAALKAAKRLGLVQTLRERAAVKVATVAAGRRPWWTPLSNPPTHPAYTAGGAMSHALLKIGLLDRAMEMQQKGQWNEERAHALFDASEDPESLRAMFVN